MEIRPFEMSVLLTSAEWLWESLLSGACFLFVLSCVTKTWARNYPATPEHATAKIHVLWDMNDCPIPEGYDACRVRPSIERALKELGYTGPVSITAFADQKQTPDHHLLALSSTGDLHSRMITDCEEWIEDNPAPATVMIISDELASPKSHSSLLCRKLQEIRPFEKPILVWDSLLAETKRNILHKCSESESESERVAASTGMFCCTLCYCDCKSLDGFNKHFSSKDHTQEVRASSPLSLSINRLSNHLSNNLFNSFYSLSNRSTECFRIFNHFLTGKGNIALMAPPTLVELLI
ncbi:hypothetical protein HID58_095927 [Brassica napus]|uniref:NYN domain-containing protein n=1 Tax=Brassica napus TaxID=3708 RepID=A0ABQ7X4C0_BRANA|nr:hypothetical protein HID58_095927 [Brassica napus]